MTGQCACPPGLIDGAAQIVRRRTGLVFGPSRMGAFQAGFTKASPPCQEPPPRATWLGSTTDPSAMDDLVAEITVGETYFFREPEQCAVIRDRILPALFSQRDRQHPSAGVECRVRHRRRSLLVSRFSSAKPVATGSHRWHRSLAGGARACPPRPLYQVVVARRAGTRGAELVPQAGRSLHLEPQPCGRLWSSSYLNLAEDVYPSLFSGIWGMDLILCRNVLIYFDAETITRVARRLIDSLSTDGWLLLGSSDPLARGTWCPARSCSPPPGSRIVGPARPDPASPSRTSSPSRCPEEARFMPARS